MKTYGNLILMTVICIVIFWVFMALRPANAQCTYRMNDYGRFHGHLSGPCNGHALGYAGAYPSRSSTPPDQWQYSWVRWELPSEVSSILAEAWFSECRGLLREVGQAQSFGHCSPVRGSNSRQTARRAWAPRLLTTNDQNIPNQHRCAVPGNGGSARAKGMR